MRVELVLGKPQKCEAQLTDVCQHDSRAKELQLITSEKCHGSLWLMWEKQPMMCLCRCC